MNQPLYTQAFLTLVDTTASLLAHNIGVTKANISLLLTPLEKDGWITRSNHTQDGRKSVISITGEGQLTS
ncbi:MarR family winged helix-turn-helix transcriptional regulator [Paenibacillus etheri]|uniref:MarR family winged helix-turn-helix transcriptional regulator n=1 Tax=Paenibacillus etheri TaxID=1306852 RepID=UPI000AA4E968|nr:MarR family transcriptional regulator [Paenibacillus etheri]